MGEMIFAKNLVKGDRREAARLRRHASEPLFGAQIATKKIDEGVRACIQAQKAGADWVDLNAGCPIDAATKKGLGSSLLYKPAKLAKLVAGLVDGSPLPVTVKLRLSGAGDNDINIDKHVALLREAGAAAVTIHGRTARARYSKPADWARIDAQCAPAGFGGPTDFSKPVDWTRVNEQHGPLAVVGNGDVLTWYEAAARRPAAGAATHALMVGRGALIKPWIFDEIATGVEWAPSAAERVGVYRQLACNFKDHFRDDAQGKRSAFYFLPWHFNFLCRWRPLPAEHFADLAARTPLMQSSREIEALLRERVEGPRNQLLPLERLLRVDSSTAHDAIAEVLWESSSDADAVAALERLATAVSLEQWEYEEKHGTGDRNSDETEGRG